jgi:hypothetical protein
MTLDLAKQQDYTNIGSSQVSIWVMSKVLASHMLQGNLATKKVTSLKIEVHSIESSTFFPQRNACLVEHEKNTEVKAMLENVMDFTNLQMKKGQDHNILHWYNTFHGQFLKTLHEHEYDYHHNLLQ